MTETTRDTTIPKLGAICAALMGLAYLALASSAPFFPDDFKVVGTGDPSKYYTALIEHPLIILFVVDGLTIIMGLAGIGAVQALSKLVDHVNPGLVRYTGFLAQFGLALKALDSFRGLALAQLRAQAWLDGDASTRAAIGATRLTLDYYAWFFLGAVGLWLLVVSIASLRSGALSPARSWLGLAHALGSLLMGAGFWFHSVAVLDVGTYALGVTGVVWWLAVAPALYRKEVAP
ncbi:MAG: DUF4386 family protein [Acidobacteriota bacterium]|jgi:hypothetical protein